MLEDSRTEHPMTIGRHDKYVQPILAPSAMVEKPPVLWNAGIEGGEFHY